MCGGIQGTEVGDVASCREKGQGRRWRVTVAKSLSPSLETKSKGLVDGSGFHGKEERRLKVRRRTKVYGEDQWG